jgi:5-carboxymethyl-2-hydroxymuconate isomerase
MITARQGAALEDAMPHLTLECSSNMEPAIPVKEILLELHQRIAELTGIPVEHFKSRAKRWEEFHVGGGGDDKGFVHLSVRIFAGRPAEIKERIGEAALHDLKRFFRPRSADTEPQMTVEIQEMKRDSYFKDPPLA